MGLRCTDCSHFQVCGIWKKLEDFANAAADRMLDALHVEKGDKEAKDTLVISLIECALERCRFFVGRLPAPADASPPDAFAHEVAAFIGGTGIKDLIRAKRGLRSLRSAAKEIGISAATLQRAERGNEIDVETFRRLCAWL